MIELLILLIMNIVLFGCVLYLYTKTTEIEEKFYIIEDKLNRLEEYLSVTKFNGYIKKGE